MKKRFIIIAVMICILALVCVLAGCDQNCPGHEFTSAECTRNADGTVTVTFTCAKCGEKVSELADVVETVIKEPTCTEPGLKSVTATVSMGGNVLNSHLLENIEIPALGHDYEYSYTWSSDNSTCTAKRVCKHNSSHCDEEIAQATHYKEIAETCEEEGLEKYTAIFENEIFKKDSVQTKDVVRPALGHDYGVTSYTWTDDHSKCTATRTCKRDSSHVDAETVITTVTTTATCDSNGKKTFTATFKNPAFGVETYKDIDEAFGHDYDGEPVYEWSEDNNTCTAKLLCTHDSSHFLSETVGTEYFVETPATCEDDGVGIYKAIFETHPSFEMQIKEVTIPAHGHVYGEPTYTWFDDNNKCSATRVCIYDASHSVIDVVEASNAVIKAPDCTNAGTRRYTATFVTNNSFVEKTKDVEIPALGHDYGEPVFTWTLDPTAGYTVSATFMCGHDSTHIIILNAQVFSQTTSATCEEEGAIVYTATVGLDNNNYNDTRTDVIPPLGHDYGEPTYAWSNDYSTCTATRVCNNDPTHTDTETVEAEYSVIVEPTCTEEGTGRYMATFGTGNDVVIKTQLVSIDALGHDYEYTYTWADGYSTCTATRVCNNDPTHTDTETVDTVYAVIVEPTCTEEGTGRYTATFTSGNSFAQQTKDVAIDALGHEYGEPTYTWSDDYSTCTATRVCAHNGEHIDAETANSTPETTATCTEAGITTYIVYFEKEAFEMQTVEVATDALGHKYNFKDFVWSWNGDHPECTATEYCTVCGEVIRENVAHYQIVPAVVVPKTCYVDGYGVYTAEFRTTDGESVYDFSGNEVVIPHGHEYEDPEYEYELIEQNGTYVCKATASKYCPECDGIEAEVVDAVFVSVTQYDGTIVLTYSADFDESKGFVDQVFSVTIQK